MTKNLLAIEIGMENMKVAVIQQSKDSYKVLKYKIVTMSDKAYDMDGYLQVNEIRTSLEAVISELKAQKMKTALVINSTKKIIRTRDLPLTSIKEMEGIVKYEAEQFLPYGIDQFYIDFKVIGSGTLTLEQADKEKQTVEGAKVMIAALPKDIMDTYMQLINIVNLKLISVTLHAEATHAFSKHHFSDTTRAFVVCDIGYGSINTILFENKEFLADISSENGLYTIINQFSTKYGIDESQSLDVLFGRLDIKLEQVESEVDQLYKKIERLNQFSGTEFNMESTNEESSDLGSNEEVRIATDQVSKYMASDIVLDNRTELYGDVLKEISRMMEFYRTRRFGARVDYIYLCGGGSKLLGLLPFLKERLDTNAIKLISEMIQIDGVDKEDTDLMVPAIGGSLGR